MNLGSIGIPQRSPDTFGESVQLMRTKKLTFDEAIQSEQFMLVQKFRLYIVQRELFEQLNKLQFTCERQMADFDLRRLAGEIAARHGIRLSTDDPALAIVTLNQLVLEETIEALGNKVRKTEESIDKAGLKVHARAGLILAQEVRKCDKTEATNPYPRGGDFWSNWITSGLPTTRTSALAF